MMVESCGPVLPPANALSRVEDDEAGLPGSKGSDLTAVVVPEASGIGRTSHCGWISRYCIMRSTATIS